MSAYIVSRLNLGSAKRPFYGHVVLDYNGERVGRSFGDIGGEKPAQELADLLNAAFEAGAVSRNQAYRDLMSLHDSASSKCISLQFELGRAEAKLRNAGIEA